MTHSDTLPKSWKSTNSRMSASGRMRSFVTVCDFSLPTACYAELNGRVRPRAGLRPTYVAKLCILGVVDFAPSFSPSHLQDISTPSSHL